VNEEREAIADGSGTMSNAGAAAISIIFIQSPGFSLNRIEPSM
jgi:hypothetical protein